MSEESKIQSIKLLPRAMINTGKEAPAMWTINGTPYNTMGLELEEEKVKIISAKDILEGFDEYK